MNRNLSKVINRKDLPQIYTMCLPSKSLMLHPTESNNIDITDGSVDKLAKQETLTSRQHTLNEKDDSDSVAQQREGHWNEVHHLLKTVLL